MDNEAAIAKIFYALSDDPLIERVGDWVDGYVRFQIDGKTIAYAIPLKRSGRVKLDFATADIKDAPKRFAGMWGYEAKGDRTRIVATPSFLKTPRALLEWVARQKKKANA